MEKLDPVVAIVLIVVGLPVAGGLVFAAYSEYLKHRKEVAALQNAGSKREVEQLKGQVHELEQRVENLESVLTSPEFQLFKERMRQIQAEAMKALPQAQQPHFPAPETPKTEKQSQR
ncbi:MAG: hypothetical protein ACUVTP_02160 [Candidatus Fervidibacter sp.]|uniref:hypothetical protein n=1 Tax=Candidatus Fervidibacter sp. TaxID=3100871 RepID=UPI0040494B36